MEGGRGRNIEYFKSKLMSIGFDMEEMKAMIETGDVTLEDVLGVVLSNEQPYSRYSAWIITHYTKGNYDLLDGFSTSIIDGLENTSHDGQLREMLRWFSVRLPKTEQLGKLIDFCFSVLANNTKPTAVRIHAMNILDNYIKQEPDLSRELIMILEEIFPHLSKGAANKAKKLILKYNKEIVG